MCLPPALLLQAGYALPPSLAVHGPGSAAMKRRRQPDTLSTVLDAERPERAPKHARAFLDAFPERVSA